MGKRSNFERLPRDLYETPYDAAVPLINRLKPGTKFHEPCAGPGALVRHLESAGHICTHKSDNYPDYGPDVEVIDALQLKKCWGDCFITNPPWDRDILHPLILNLSDIAPTWLLFDADWMHTKQAIPYMAKCIDIISVGRVKWIPGSKMTGKENVCWYRFWREKITPTTFHSRK